MEKTKVDLRKSYLEKRDSLTPISRARDSAIIRHRVVHHLEWQDANTVLMYVSFRSEVDTHKLIKEALEQQKRVIIPVTDTIHKEVTLSELRSYGDLAPGPFHGIFEPAPALRRPVDPAEIELALVPGAVFDRQGGRIGFGGGYFDKLLAIIPQARRMGLAFSTQVHAKPLPHSSHDIRMQLIVTEKEVVKIT